MFNSKIQTMTEAQIRTRILRRISRVPKERLKELDEFVLSLQKQQDHKNKTLSYAGAWKDIDEDIFNSFTSKLIQRRKRNRQRING